MSYYAEIYGSQAGQDYEAKIVARQAMYRNERQAAAEDEANRQADEAYRAKTAEQAQEPTP